MIAGSAVSWHNTWPRYDGLLWGLCGSGSWALLCVAVTFAGTRLGWWHAHVPSRRRPRLALLSVSVVAAAAVWLLCERLGAPASLLGLGSTAPWLAALLLACTWVSNVSLHTSAATASVTLHALELGPAWTLLYPLAGAVGWSRLHLRAHTPRQVLAGAVLGTVCVALISSSR
ncbi:phosphatase PAP2 family protein [Streptomyces sp. NPDC096048]|uniref:phosphatase PAP2 family protein n=1 Tax=Streptomyces sp. NPDC096048 TaxID=3366072 RepID=UPI0037FF0685